jgi:hypothetical protein
MSLIIPANSAVSGGFDVANSCMFNSADTPHMQKTFSAGNRTTWTVSVWTKRGILGSNMRIFTYGSGGDPDDRARFLADNTIEFQCSAGGELTTTRVFRDTSSWYHFVFVYDSTNGTAGNRMRMYVNGVEETVFTTDTNPSLNLACAGANVNGEDANIVRDGYGGGEQYFDGYMAEFVHIDGTALAPTDVGEFDEDSGIWKPIDVSGLTFGTNGFYLDFEDSANLGNDANGGTDLTETNLAATDQAIDTCTNNFATFNANYKSANQPTYTQGNTTATSSGAGYRLSFSTIAVSTGKWYAEFKRGAGEMMIGISSLHDAETLFNVTDYYLGETAKSLGIAYNDGDYIIGGSQTAYGASYADGDTVGIALDLTNKKLYASKNGAWSNGSGTWDSATFDAAVGDIDISGVIPSGEYAYLGCSNTGTSTVSANFGSPYYAISSGNADGDGYGNFEYAVPSGYFSLCTKNLAEYG